MTLHLNIRIAEKPFEKRSYPLLIDTPFSSEDLANITHRFNSLNISYILIGNYSCRACNISNSYKDILNQIYMSGQSYTHFSTSNEDKFYAIDLFFENDAEYERVNSYMRSDKRVTINHFQGDFTADLSFIGKNKSLAIPYVLKLYGKGSKERIIPIENTSVLTILSDYYFIHEEKISDCGYFFVNKYGKRLTEQSVRCMINSYCQTCGISMHITPHMFRHSFATLLLEQDVDIRYIQKLLGHSSITTTQIYTHVTSAKQKEIIKTKHPRNNLNIN